LAKLQAENTEKTRITIFLDGDILTAFKERAAKSGKGYQTLINEALRTTLDPDAEPLTEATLREVLREELSAVRPEKAVLG
jgi:BrnA antitoxin of type II toxin-antitoxin system